MLSYEPEQSVIFHQPYHSPFHHSSRASSAVAEGSVGSVPALTPVSRVSVDGSMVMVPLLLPSSSSKVASISSDALFSTKAVCTSSVAPGAISSNWFSITVVKVL